MVPKHVIRTNACPRCMTTSHHNHASIANQGNPHGICQWLIFSKDFFFYTGTFIQLIRLNVVLGMDSNSKTHLVMGDFLRWLFINPWEPTALPRDEPMSALNPLTTQCQLPKQSMLGRLGMTRINQACRGVPVYFGFQEAVCIDQA